MAERRAFSSCFFLTSRPSEAPGFNPLIKQAEAIALPYQAFEPVSAASAEKKQNILLKRIQMELFLY
ncbi:hypothetical protein NSB28_13040 [Murimonas intestini]|nr:hypothetical protein [Murimonas intestini]MCR1842114.1 hypothetical protein [Murimonas intestini]MCR1884178.1 hypothetical protein [Murimonas intestini]